MGLFYCILYIQLHLRKESLGLIAYVMTLILGVGLVGLIIGMSSLEKISLIATAMAAFCHVLGATYLFYDTLKGNFGESGDEYIKFKRQYLLRDCFAKDTLFCTISILFDIIFSSTMFFIFSFIPVYLGLITYKADINIIFSIILILWFLLATSSVFRSLVWLRLNKEI